MRHRDRIARLEAHIASDQSAVRFIMGEGVPAHLPQREARAWLREEVARARALGAPVFTLLIDDGPSENPQPTITTDVYDDNQ
jgi:hypothetical protein